MRLMNALVALLGLALVACGPAGTTKKQEPSPLPPLKRTPGADPSPNVTAKGGTLIDPTGKQYDLAQAYASSNALLVFYRGGW